MALIKSYTKVINGRAVTVRSYAQHRGDRPGGDEQPQSTAPKVVGPILPSIVHAHANPQMVVAPPGTYRFVRFPQGVYSHGRPPKGLVPANRSTLTTPTHGWLELSAEEDFLALAANAASEWSNAVRVGIDHILLVLKNNPKRTMDDVLNRPDIQDALRHIGLTGAQAAIRAIQETWDENGGPADSQYLASILSDMGRNGFTFAPRISEALRGGDRDQVEKVILKDRLRAAAAQAAAETRARAEAAMQAFEDAGVTHVRWRAHLDSKTCSGCLALNNTVVGLRQEFDHLAGGLSVPVYFNLISPPRHPNCRCWLEAVEE